VDGRGVPLSIIVTAANVNDSKRLEQVLKAIAVSRPMPTQRRSKHLCADAGYRGAELRRIIEWHGYIPHVVDRRQESNAKRRHPSKKARRWVVEVCHSWFNRFRKLLVRYEKLERSFMALNHLAAAIIAFRKVPLAVNVIYG
jgi:IS5 family transposase